MKRSLIKIIFLVYILNNSLLYAQDDDSYIPNIVDDKIVSIQAPTEVGMMGDIFYSFYGTEMFWYIGPGIFFDYKISPELTLSVNSFFNFQSFTGAGDSFIIKPGVYVKHWLSNTWGYVGIGLDGFIYTGIQGDYFQLMLSAIVTGENVKLKDNINTVGDLKISISLFSTAPIKELRFNIAYCMGVAFDFSSSKSIYQENQIN